VILINIALTVLSLVLFIAAWVVVQHIRWRRLDPAIWERVKLRKEELKRMRPSDLRELPSSSLEKLRLADRTLDLAVCEERLPSGEHLIVAVAWADVFLGYLSWPAGFIVAENGEIRDADEEMLFDH